MATVHDVMAYIRERMPNASKLERHKFAYYAQAWNAAWEGRPLYPERIEAWKNGPVVRAAWVAEKYGPEPETHALAEDEARVVDAVLAFYGALKAPQLRALTHLAAPWVDARGGLPEGVSCEEEIPVSHMRSYYTRKVLAGEATPTHPPTCQESQQAKTLQIADAAIARWSDALERLGQ